MAEPSDRGSAAARSGFTAPTGSDALRRLAQVTSELGAATSLAEIADAAVEHAAAAIHAAVTTLMLRDGDRLVLIGGHGLRAGVDERWRSFGITDTNPASEALRTARPVLISDAAEVVRRYPVLLGDMPSERSLVCLPLGTGAPVGVAGLTFEHRWLPGPRELDLLTAFADACGQAIRRVRAADEAAERSAQLAFLADASAELASSLDYRATLANVARLVVPGLADWCAVDIVERDTITTVAVAHVDPAKTAWAWELQRRYPPDPAAETGVPNVVRTGTSEIYPEITDEMLVAGARDEEHLRISRELELHSAIVVPLTARGRTLGAITLVRAETPRPYGPSDLLVAEELGRRAGLAVDNAHLHSQTRDAALQLQRAVLPGALPALPGWDLAAHYEPGGAAEVGGDFYDAMQLPDGALAIVIGDVMGHGVPAAAAMAQLHASVRAFITVDPAPAVVLSRLQEMIIRLGLGQFASLVYARACPEQRSLELVNAGHLAPLLVHADGMVEFAHTPTRRLLGADPDECVASEFAFGPGDTLLMFTDGLVERRDEHIDEGLQRLVKHLDALRCAELGMGLSALVHSVQGAEGDDDVTALAVRRRPAPG